MAVPPKKKLGVILVNLGTPDAPTPSAVRRYLRQFLSDSRVIEVPRPIWWLILNAFILPFRPKRVAKLYASIWERDDSPMRRILHEQCVALEQSLSHALPAADIRVLAAMTYGQPSLPGALDRLQADGVEQLIVLPLFPQYSATSTAAAFDALQRWCAGARNLPSLLVIKDYYAHERYIQALANSVQEFWAQHGRADKLLMSFHGIPQPYADKGDPYAERCRETARLLAARLELAESEWVCSFQSRFGLQEWVKPYTDAQLAEWAEQGVRSVQVMCPAFSADCLETLEEIAEQNREGFLHAGGQRYEYIPALNTRADHIALFQALVLAHAQAMLA